MKKGRPTTKYIVIHCTAGFAGVEAIQRFWKKNLRWKNPGYHRIVDVYGGIHKLANYNRVCNGVRGFNEEAIHIAYIGGVNPNNVNQAQDTRTPQQKLMLQHCISDALLWLEKNEVNLEYILVCGHRDFSTDQNNNGVIEPWERIKECPSFEAAYEYRHYSGLHVRGKLPTQL